jgi:hypothetical protein
MTLTEQAQNKRGKGRNIHVTKKLWKTNIERTKEEKANKVKQKDRT